MELDGGDKGFVAAVVFKKGKEARVEGGAGCGERNGRPNDWRQDVSKPATDESKCSRLPAASPSHILPHFAQNLVLEGDEGRHAFGVAGLLGVLSRTKERDTLHPGASARVPTRIRS